MKALTITGTLTEEDVTTPGTFRRYTYQRVAKGTGNIDDSPNRTHQRRLCVIPTDPKTTAQRVRRDMMTAAVSAWQDATPIERELYREDATRRAIPLYNAFVSAFLAAHQPIYTTWDAGATEWDAGATIFDYTR